jgi:hypothetical protein
MDLTRWLKNQWDRTSAVALVIAGLVALLLGWLGVSRSSLATEQIPYLVSGAVLGLFLLGMGATLWLSADLRDEWRKLDDLYQVLRGEHAVAGERPMFLEAVVPVEVAELEPAGHARRRRSGARHSPVPAPLDE